MAINLRGRTASSDPSGRPVAKQPTKVSAKAARYIKLGPKGSWERRCVAEGILLFGYQSVPHELAMSRDQERLTRFVEKQGHKKGTAKRHALQILDFYTLGADTLWITFADGFLWWCFAEPEVFDLGLDDEKASREGSKLRRTVNGWHNMSVGGRPLFISELNGALVQTRRFQGTICDVKLFDYLLRKLNDEDLPEISRAREARRQSHTAIQGLMALLTWRDFEILVDLVFSASGGRRIGEGGGSQKTVDLELVLPTTGERAFVQIKSRTSQAQLDDYVERLKNRPEARMFYVYHSADASLVVGNPGVRLIGPDRLAEMVLDAGLFTWLLQKAG